MTGGSRGMGAAMALTRVALTYTQSEDRAHALVARIEQEGGVAMALRADNREADAPAPAVDDSTAAFGPSRERCLRAGVYQFDRKSPGAESPC
ncbi:MAG TPA: hypothetical protein VK973_10700 [Arenicellales bacterium]|nr:hypothetical protein [Arenicellales bacterium]